MDSPTSAGKICRQDMAKQNRGQRQGALIMIAFNPLNTIFFQTALLIRLLYNFFIWLTNEK